MTGMFQRLLPVRRPRAARGSVTLEFVISFPIVLITFFFAWQVVNVFIYDILGTYAAFAAARSYSVFRWHNVEDGDTDGVEARARAAALARDVAAAIMAPYTMKWGDEADNLSGWNGKQLPLATGRDDASSDGQAGESEDASGVEKAAQLLGAFVSRTSSLLPYETARARMTPFSITEYGPNGAESYVLNDANTMVAVKQEASPEQDAAPGDTLILPFRVDYGYTPTSARLEKAGGGWQPVTAGEKAEGFDLLTWIKGLFGWKAKTDKKDDSRCGMMVARVSFSYRYPFFTAYLHRGLFASATNDIAKADYAAIPIYNACAAPIEPVVCNVESNFTIRPVTNMVDTTAITNADMAIKQALDALGATCLWVRAVLTDTKQRPDCTEWRWDTHQPPSNWQRASSPGAPPAETQASRNTWINDSTKSEKEQKDCGPSVTVTDYKKWIGLDEEYRMRVRAAIEQEIDVLNTIISKQNDIGEKKSEIAAEQKQKKPNTTSISKWNRDIANDKTAIRNCGRADLADPDVYSSQLTQATNEQNAWKDRHKDESAIISQSSGYGSASTQVSVTDDALTAGFDKTWENVLAALAEWHKIKNQETQKQLDNLNANPTTQE